VRDGGFAGITLVAYLLPAGSGDASLANLPAALDEYFHDVSALKDEDDAEFFAARAHSEAE
jgi:hypothetical protein